MDFDKERQDIYFEAMVRGEIDEKMYKQALKGKAWIRGTRVKVKGRSMNSEGIGTICDVKANEESIGVKFDTDIRGHDCNGNCEYGYGWYYGKNQLQLI